MKINGHMEFSNKSKKKRLSKVPNVEVSDLFKDYDFHLVQLLNTSLIKMNALS